MGLLRGAAYSARSEALLTCDKSVQFCAKRPGEHCTETLTLSKQDQVHRGGGGKSWLKFLWRNSLALDLIAT